MTFFISSLNWKRSQTRIERTQQKVEKTFDPNKNDSTLLRDRDHHNRTCNTTNNLSHPWIERFKLEKKNNLALDDSSSIRAAEREKETKWFVVEERRRLRSRRFTPSRKDADWDRAALPPPWEPRRERERPSDSSSIKSTERDAKRDSRSVGSSRRWTEVKWWIVEDQSTERWRDQSSRNQGILPFVGLEREKGETKLSIVLTRVS